ncbi:hypothetical protein KPH14_012005 [Odynerus spinipes]|uniref:Uncharacterized protein n=1 Tax=Odynerus spinipes TaxID=1348599 RepID=A0AAD9VKB9_9HYME|nr:hypothetical protein KPH14_012005 [Odynerus spinipes]
MAGLKGWLLYFAAAADDGEVTAKMTTTPETTRTIMAVKAAFDNGRDK